MTTDGVNMAKVMKLEILRCPTHDTWSISIGDENSGTRVVTNECCGRWELFREWSLSASEWKRMKALCEEALEWAE